MRIGFYSPALPGSGSSNGIVTYVGVMRDTLRAKGHEVMVVTETQAESFTGHVSDLKRTGFKNGFRHAKRAGAEVFEIEESFGWSVHLRGIPVVVRLHGPHALGREPVESPEQRKLSDKKQRDELKAISLAKFVTSPARGIFDALGVEGRVIPNPQYDTLERWSIERADLNQIVFVGRHDLRKGADIMLSAFAKARAVKPSLRLIMVGPDYGIAQPDGSLKHFKSQDGVEYLGIQPKRMIEKLRAESGITVLASRFESFAYIAAEAMAGACPVVSTATHGPLELIRDGVDGRIVPIADPEALANAMLEMLAEPQRLQEMSASALDRVRNVCSPGRIAEETLEVYRAALA